MYVQSSPVKRGPSLTKLIPAVETIGYCGRIWSHFDTTVVGGFVMQAIPILIAPALFAASIYMILGRLIRTLRAEHLFFIPVKWVTRIFVIGDVTSFTLQAGGGGIQAGGTLELYNLGEKIIVAGLFLQLLFFGFFVIASITFHLRLSKSPTAVALHGPVHWKRYLWILYITSGLILVRSVFRVIEYLQGNDGYIIAHEVFLYIFDMALMLLVMIIFLIWYVDDLDTRPTAKRRHLPSSSDCMLDELPSQHGHFAK